jgi:hypothetical protein
MDLTSIVNWLLVVLIGACTAMGALSPLVALLKHMTGLPRPDDSKAKQRWFRVLHVLDYCAANSDTVRAQLQTLQHRETIAVLQSALVDQHAVIAEQERNHIALLVSLKKEAP